MYIDIRRNFMKQVQINIFCAFHYPKISGGAELQFDIELQTGENLLLIPKIICIDGRKGRRNLCRILKQIM